MQMRGPPRRDAMVGVGPSTTSAASNAKRWTYAQKQRLGAPVPASTRRVDLDRRACQAAHAPDMTTAALANSRADRTEALPDSMRIARQHRLDAMAHDLG
jgi:hypothetical protein